MKNPILAILYLSPQEILKKNQIMNRYPNQLAIGRYHGSVILLKPWIMAGILLRLMGPFFTKAVGTNSSLNICCSLVRKVTWLYAPYNTLETHIINTFFTSSYEAWQAFPEGHLGRFNTNSITNVSIWSNPPKTPFRQVHIVFFIHFKDNLKTW